MWDPISFEYHNLFVNHNTGKVLKGILSVQLVNGLVTLAVKRKLKRGE
jgi:hypothetical protein